MADESEIADFGTDLPTKQKPPSGMFQHFCIETPYLLGTYGNLICERTTRFQCPVPLAKEVGILEETFVTAVKVSDR